MGQTTMSQIMQCFYCCGQDQKTNENEYKIASPRVVVQSGRAALSNAKTQIVHNYEYYNKPVMSALEQSQQITAKSTAYVQSYIPSGAISKATDLA